MSDSTHTTIRLRRGIHEELKVKATRRAEKLDETAEAALRIGLPKLKDKKSK